MSRDRRTLARSSRLAFQLFRASAPWTQDTATLALGVVDGKRLCVGLVMEIESGTLRNVTNLDFLHLDTPLTISAESFERLWRAFARNLHSPAAALLCDRTTYQGLVNAADKLSYLAAVGHVQPYFYRVELD